MCYKEIDCDECDGLGEYDVIVYCGKPVSVCCGGCTETVTCEKCNGNGLIEKEIEDE